MGDSYAHDESQSQIVAETMWLQGALLNNLLYGIDLILFFICCKHVVRKMTPSNRKRQVCNLIFIATLFMLGTLGTFGNVNMTQRAFINHRNYPGGPARYETDMFWIPSNELGTVATVFGNWLMDSLLVWRYMAIFAGVSVVPTWAIITVPCLMLTASVGLGLLFLVETSRSSPFDAVTATVPYFAMTISLNVLLTMLIVARLLRFRSRLVRALGEEHGKYYGYLSMVLVESASLFAVFSSMLLITEAVNSSLAYLILQIVGQIQVNNLIASDHHPHNQGEELFGRHFHNEANIKPAIRRDVNICIKFSWAQYNNIPRGVILL
ncbi:predicted protein [Postia placenta Mad-698-R]|uniref:Chitin synthase export chaperone n=1 Tax=Postia placenta MAD-698-R-SB12 TaxID=670580 RepID=A0A1X6N4K7_9APHY|nr:hypothetical protein POSPLADRAFT_1045891 [Postia placenta MAD-698-R-SB12]EED84964.1 predicted protein [Postia placenta Mad-698-R]OSX63579.1 hypothetical protein POSPLADRAFT_1045891 [Postia placenta MAD-698-R-SB12]